LISSRNDPLDANLQVDRHGELPPPGPLERLQTWYEDVQGARRHEQYGPSAWALVAGGVAGGLGLSLTAVQGLVVSLVPSALTVAALLAGFQTTALSLMLVLMKTPALVALRDTVHYGRLVQYFWAASRTLCAFIAVALLVLALTSIHVQIPGHTRIVPAVLAFTFVRSALSSLRVNRLMTKLLLQNGR
jgi:hypothetical protein